MEEGIETRPVSPRYMPDFILIGAQKCGTSSVHYILDHHPKVFIPKGEVFFFDVDDVEQHPDFFVPTPGGWTDHDFWANLDTYLPWYRRLFEAAEEGQLRGEDSTTYLASRVAPERIARLAPRCRLIAMLRDPVARAWCHYWHGVATGRATLSFEKTLLHRPGNILRRGFYAEQLERYLRYVPREQLKVVLFEEFIKEPQRVTDDLCAYLGLPGSVDLTTVDKHRNAARAPLSLRARLLVNTSLRPLVAKSYNRKIPFMPGYRPDSVTARVERHPWFQRVSDWIEDVRPRRPYPPMNPDTRDFLAAVYRRRNAALQDLLGRDLTPFWPWMGGQGS
jgi:hypothetical protein